MSADSSEETPQKQRKDEDFIVQITTNDAENTNTTNKENKEETNRSSEAVKKINESLKQNLKRNIHDRDYMVGYHGQNQKLPTTLVYFQLFGPQAPVNESGPMEYTPGRNAFVRLVLIMVFIMVVATAGLNALVFITEDLTFIFRKYGLYLSIGALVLVVSVNYALACMACARRPPCNIICLILGVLGMSIICCYVTIRFKTTVVLLAVAATAGVVLICTLLACTRFDFTKWLLYVVVIAAAFSAAVIAASLYMLITGHYIKMLHLAILIGGTVLNAIFLTIELQMVLGGKTVSLSEDDYAMGAFMIYNSIINLFMNIVQLLDIADFM